MIAKLLKWLIQNASSSTLHKTHGTVFVMLLPTKGVLGFHMGYLLWNQDSALLVLKEYVDGIEITSKYKRLQTQQFYYMHIDWLETTCKRSCTSSWNSFIKKKTKKQFLRIKNWYYPWGRMWLLNIPVRSNYIHITWAIDWSWK